MKIYSPVTDLCREHPRFMVGDRVVCGLEKGTVLEVYGSDVSQRDYLHVMIMLVVRLSSGKTIKVYQDNVKWEGEVQ